MGGRTDARLSRFTHHIGRGPDGKGGPPLPRPVRSPLHMIAGSKTEIECIFIRTFCMNPMGLEEQR